MSEMIEMFADEVKSLVKSHPYLAMIVIFIIIDFIQSTIRRLPKKSFSKEKVTNIVITGGAQGLGSMLASHFL